MGFLKKITRPISRALDKIIPNEVKPALPFLAAAAPFMAPGLMGLGGNTMLSRALMSGGLNLGAQLAQEGSEGDFSGLSTLMAAATGALSTPGSAGGRTLPDGSGGSYSQVMGGDKLASTGTQSAGDFFKNKTLGMEPGFAKSGLGALETSSNYLTGVGETLRNDLFSKEGLKAALVPVGQGMTDLGIAGARRAQKDYERELADYEASIGDSSDMGNRALAIRQSMEAYGFPEDEILAAIEAAGYANGGRVGYAFGDLVRGSSMVQPAGGLAIKLNRPVESGDPLGSYYPDPSKMKTASPIMPRSGMGGMLSNLINSNPQIFSNITNQENNSVSNMSRDFIDLNQNGIDDRQEKAIGGRVGLANGGDPGPMGNPAVITEIDNMREFNITDPDVEDIEFQDIKETVKEVDKDKVKSDIFGLGDPELVSKVGEDINEGILSLSDVITDKDGSVYLPIQYLRKLGEDMFFGGQKNPKLPEKMYDKLSDEYIEEMKKVKEKGYKGGLMNLGGREMDMRTGGFIPIGKKERADDVPARLSKNEFVMTADAVRAAGGGSVNEGARRMYNLMNNLEAKV
jgi:hypothetical protein